MGKNETRAHHFVPQCWLAGFTDSGEKDGMLYVTDLKRKKQWRCKPSEAGHRRDFYRVEDPSVRDPLAIEKIFSDIEGKVAPLLRSLFHEKRGPIDGSELGLLVEFLTIQWIRVPSFRTLVDRTVRAKHREELLGTPERWKAALEKTGVSLDDPHTDYAKMLEMIDSKDVTFSAQPGFYLQLGANVIPDIEKALHRTHWGWLVSPTGQFIGSDSPIAFDGEEGEPIGFGTNCVMVYPVTRYLLLYGTSEPIPTPYVTTKLIAQHNTFMMLSTDEQIYSFREDFHWLDKANKCQNDWRMFNAADFRKPIAE